MRVLPSIAVVFVLASLAHTASGHRVIVRLDGLGSDGGRAYVALYASPAGFPGGSGALRTAGAPIAGGTATVALDAVAPGTYAVAVVHDENGNGRLDTNFLGIPHEGIGASNGAQGRFGPARFDDAKFTVSADTMVPVTIVYVDFF